MNTLYWILAAIFTFFLVALRDKILAKESFKEILILVFVGVALGLSLSEEIFKIDTFFVFLVVGCLTGYFLYHKLRIQNYTKKT